MGKIVAGIGTSHVPSIGVAYDKGEQKTDAWSPLFNVYEPVQEWLAELKPDVAIISYNDHGCDFFFDKYPTFAIGAAHLQRIRHYRLPRTENGTRIFSADEFVFRQRTKLANKIRTVGG